MLQVVIFQVAAGSWVWLNYGRVWQALRSGSQMLWDRSVVALGNLNIQAGNLERLDWDFKFLIK